MLREVARPLEKDEIGSEAIRTLIVDMTDTLHDYGGVGLAAPQIAEPVRLAIIEITADPGRYGEMPEMPLTVFINPEIEVVDPEKLGFWEGCLSVPGLRGYVERPRQVQVRYLTEHGEPKVLKLAGFFATVFQHEFDHLDGKLYIDQITDTRLLAFEKEFERYLLPMAEPADTVDDDIEENMS